MMKGGWTKIGAGKRAVDGGMAGDGSGIEMDEWMGVVVEAPRGSQSRQAQPGGYPVDARKGGVGAGHHIETFGRPHTNYSLFAPQFLFHATGAISLVTRGLFLAVKLHIANVDLH